MAFGSRPRGVLHAARDVSMPRGGDLSCVPRNEDGGFSMKQVLKANRFLCQVRRVLKNDSIQSPEQLRHIVGLSFEAFEDDDIWKEHDVADAVEGFEDKVPTVDTVVNSNQGTSASSAAPWLWSRSYCHPGGPSWPQAPSGAAMDPQQQNRPLAALLATFPPFQFGPEKREHPEGEVQQGSGPRPRTH